MHSMNNPNFFLGIESTAHTFGASIVSNYGKILSNEKDIYIPPAGKGIHPRDATQHHCEKSPQVIWRAFKEANLKPKDLTAIAFSAGPGLGPSLRIGATIARALASFLNKPLVPVNHAIGHIEIAFLTTGSQDPLVVLVSGGHTLITAYAGFRWRIFGETEDITIGNLLDMFAREIGLSPPSGVSVERKASQGKKLVELPYTVKGNDVTYSGLLSASLRKFRKGDRIEDLCYSLQEVSFSMLAETVERSLAHTEKKELLLTGGVAANKRLQEMLRIIAKDHNSKFHVVDPRYSGDSGAQIAWTGYLAFKQGIRIDIDKSYVIPKWRLDEIEWKRL